mgnify:CR=1 FL=1
MMRIAVISDTHWSSWDLKDRLVCELETLLTEGRFDQIWHAGDVTGSEVLEKLDSFGPVVCVKGNCDRFLYRQLPHSVTETLEEVKVGMTHGWDLPLDHAPFVKSRFAADVDIIIHGHTHRRRYQEIAGEHPTTIINPGSVSSPRGGETPGYGVLEIDGDKWTYESHSFPG